MAHLLPDNNWKLSHFDFYFFGHIDAFLIEHIDLGVHKTGKITESGFGKRLF